MKGVMKTQAPTFFKSIFKLQNPIFKNIIFEALNNTIGVLSLSEKSDNILMWGHYANSHKGFVIGFDKTHSFFDQRKKEGEIQGVARKVNYLRERPKITLYDSSLNNDENMKVWIEKFIWFKNIDWKYEKEWRMIYTFKDKEDIVTKVDTNIFLFPLPVDCIKSIIFGCKMSEENKRRLRTVLKSHSKYHHIQIFQAVEDEKEFTVNIVKLNR
ncbi:MAG: DUF2971 domain-containing protein [Candidatus Omnitrophica bacterium]|nr:DUF2971 domain-containing protein [Candidatus Omnitrophota bacterium]